MQQYEMGVLKHIQLVLLAFIAHFSCIGCGPVWLKYDQVAADFQFDRAVISTSDFNIVVYKNQLFGSGKKLHVYFDGDGSPWKQSGPLINDDPTPRQYLVLQMMSVDTSPAILIGRPCYHGFSHDENCHPLLWTHARYSEKVVSAIGVILAIILAESGTTEVVLIGYSGGGTLVQLLAERIPQTRGILTLAANLDIAAWAKLHGYSALDGSLNPAERPPLPDHILQIHYVGRSDDNIPPKLTEHYLSRKGGGEMRVLDEVDHYNGWLENWPAILLDLNKRLQ